MAWPPRTTTRPAADGTDVLVRIYRPASGAVAGAGAVLGARRRAGDGQRRPERRHVRGDRRSARHRGGVGRVPPRPRAPVPGAAGGLLRRAALVGRSRRRARHRPHADRHRRRQRRRRPRRRSRPARPRSRRGRGVLPAARVPDARRPQRHAEQPHHRRPEGVEPRGQRRRLERLPRRAGRRRRRRAVRRAGPGHRPRRAAAHLHRRRRPRPVPRRGHRLRPGA